MVRFLLELLGYKPEEQNLNLERICKVEDHWGEGQDDSEPVDQYQAEEKAITNLLGKGVPHKEKIKNPETGEVIVECGGQSVKRILCYK